VRHGYDTEQAVPPTILTRAERRQSIRSVRQSKFTAETGTALDGLIIVLALLILVGLGIVAVGAFAAHTVAHIVKPSKSAPPPATAVKHDLPNDPNVIFSDDLTSTHHDRGWTKKGGCIFALDGCHLSNASTMNNDIDIEQGADISVTVAWFSGDPDAEFGIGFDDRYTVLVSGLGFWRITDDVMLEGGIPQTAGARVMFGSGVVNTLRVRIRPFDVTLFLNGVQLGALLTAPSPRGPVQLIADGHDSTSSEVIFTDLIVRRV
jgi:hypothetical protein